MTVRQLLSASQLQLTAEITTHSLEFVFRLTFDFHAKRFGALCNYLEYTCTCNYYVNVIFKDNVDNTRAESDHRLEQN